MRAFVTDPAARKERQLARLAEMRQAEAADRALGHIRQDMAAGRDLKFGDIISLTRQQRDLIREKGEDGLRQLVEEQRQREQSRDHGRER